MIEDRLSVEQSGYIPLIVIYEVYWVLTRQYRLDEQRVREALADLMAVASLIVEHSSSIQYALRDEGGLADALVHRVGTAAGASRTYTFDRKFARLANVELLTEF